MNKSPISNNQLELYFDKVQDYMVSHETFQLLHDKSWDMLLTSPIPEQLSDYYESVHYKPHQHDSKSLFDRLYNLIRKSGYQYKHKLIRTYNPEAKSVLDYGTATGEFLSFLQKKTFLVSGVEPSKLAREQAENILDCQIAVSIDDIKGSFDVISLWHVLEHVQNLNELIEKLKQKLNKNGVLLVAVPNFKSADALHYNEYWAAYDVPRHLWHFSPNSMHALFAKHQMSVIAQKPLFFDSFYVSLLSEKYKNGKPNYIKAFFQGARSNFKALKTGNYSSLIYVIKAEV